MKPVGAAIEKRQRAIADGQEAAKKYRDEAAAKLDNYEKVLGQNRSEAQAIIGKAVAEAQAERTKAVGKVKDEGRGKLEAAKTKLDSERADLLENLVAEEAKLVQDIVGKLLGSSAKVDVNSAAVKRALEEAI